MEVYLGTNESTGDVISISEAVRKKHMAIFGKSGVGLSRMHCTRNLLEIVESISTAKARFQSISEPWADTTTYAGKMIMTIFAGIAEFERDLIRERTGAGRADAKKRGVRFGRPPLYSSFA